MRAVAATILVIAATQNPPAPAAPLQTPPPNIFERQWNHTLIHKTGPDGNRIVPQRLGLAAGPQRVFVTDDENGVEARAVTDGALAWRAQLPSDLPAAIAGEQVFVASGGQLHALDEATGRTRWARPLTPTPVALVRHDSGVITAGGKVVRAWSADGNVVWERTLAGDIGRELVAVDGGLVYLGLTDLTLAALDAGTGTPRWIERIGTVPLGLTATGGKLYFGGTDENLHAYDRNGGRTWMFRRADVIGAPAVDQELVYATLWDSTVVAYAKGNGHLQWRQSLDNRPVRGPMLSGPFVVAVLQSDAVVAIPIAQNKPAAAAAPASPAPPSPAPAAAPPTQRTHNQVKVAAPSADGSQIFAVIQLDNQDRVVVAYKRAG